MKIKRKNTIICDYPGMLTVQKRIKKKGIPKIIDECFGLRPAQSTYQYKDVLLGWVMTILTEGSRLVRMEDSKSSLSLIPGLKLCSHDTVGRILKKLATENDIHEYENKKKKKGKKTTYFINENRKLNELLVQITKALGLLEEGVSYTLDVDVTVIPSKTSESQWSYKGYNGYAPMVCMINKVPVFISMRSGNGNSKLFKKECIEKCLIILSKHKIKVGRVRIDGAGYGRDVTHFLKQENIDFVIGAETSFRTWGAAYHPDNKWEEFLFKTSESTFKAEFSSVPFSLSRSKDVFRLVTQRVKKEVDPNKREKVTKWSLLGDHYYKFILTSDENTKPIDICYEYNQRGASEQNFDCLKNDFGWKILPFSHLNENLVHLIISAIANNVYQGILKFVNGHIPKIKLSFRLEHFIREFMKRGKFSIEKGTYIFYNCKIHFEKIT